jgi:hypothetical protein
VEHFSPPLVIQPEPEVQLAVAVELGVGKIIDLQGEKQGSAVLYDAAAILY